ncbi:hypothetical protein Lser_V15G30200 [Lactuca serriola]
MTGRKDGRREEYQLLSIMKFAGTFKFRLLVMPISFKYLKNIETDSSGNFIVYQEMRCYFLTAQRLDTESSMEAVIGFQMNKGKEDVYFAIRGSKTADDVILIERNRERNVQRWKVASKKYWSKTNNII